MGRYSVCNLARHSHDPLQVPSDSRSVILAAEDKGDLKVTFNHNWWSDLRHGPREDHRWGREQVLISREKCRPGNCGLYHSQGRKIDSMA